MSLVCLLAAGCVSGTTTHGRGRVIQPDRFDAAVFFCVRPLLATSGCTHQATATEVAQVRDRLLADPAVAVGGVVYVSPQQAIRIALQAGLLPPAAAQLGKLPASFVVALNGASVEQFAANYRGMPGVDDVVPCTDRPYCHADVLRSVGAMH